MTTNFQTLRAINVNEHVEQKDGLNYLSWAWAWDIFKQNYPDATYTIMKTESGLPYFESNAGAMVYTQVTAGGITHEMWLPVMDGKNKAMKAEPYTYTTKFGEKSVEAFTMFDVNKTLMRCLVKNLAMFGLALYIYRGEDLPQLDEESQAAELSAMINDLKKANTLDDLKSAYIAAINKVGSNSPLKKAIDIAKDQRKAELGG
jgi:hypothetical protein